MNEEAKFLNKILKLEPIIYFNHPVKGFIKVAENNIIDFNASGILSKIKTIDILKSTIDFSSWSVEGKYYHLVYCIWNDINNKDMSSNTSNNILLPNSIEIDIHELSHLMKQTNSPLDIVIDIGIRLDNLVNLVGHEDGYKTRLGSMIFTSLTHYNRR